MTFRWSKPARNPVHIDPAEAQPEDRMVRLPGEILQVQMGS